MEGRKEKRKEGREEERKKGGKKERKKELEIGRGVKTTLYGSDQ